MGMTTNSSNVSLTVSQTPTPTPKPTVTPTQTQAPTHTPTLTPNVTATQKPSATPEPKIFNSSEVVYAITIAITLVAIAAVIVILRKRTK
jgi:hypothetical protein